MKLLFAAALILAPVIAIAADTHVEQPQTLDHAVFVCRSAENAATYQWLADTNRLMDAVKYVQKYECQAVSDGTQFIIDDEDYSRGIIRDAVRVVFDVQGTKIYGFIPFAQLL